MKLTLLTRATALFGLATLAFTGSQRAHAVLVNGTFTGTVMIVSGALGTTVQSGYTITGTFQYDTSAAPVGDSNQANFKALTDFNFDIKDLGNSSVLASGGFTNQASPVSEIQMYNDLGPADFDHISIVPHSDELAVPSLNGNAFSFGVLRMTDSTENVFNDASVLPTSLSRNDFNAFSFFDVFFDIGGDLGVIDMSLDTLTTTSSGPVVPEPATLSLIGMGLAGAGMVRRRCMVR